MKLLRYGPPGREKPGLADADGNVRDLSKIITQIDDAMLAPRNLARLARVKPETLPIVRGNPR
ncbi:MAG: ureidoglycolate lyase, partial [Usitatibacter sp.]